MCDLKGKLPISCIILSYNEEQNISKCLESIYCWAGEIFVIDSFSTDRTLDTVKRYTDKIFQRDFKTHAEQWNWAFRNLPFTFEWCMALDADQVVTLELQHELREVFKSAHLDPEGFYINRRQFFRGRWIRFGGYYPKYLLRLFRVKGVYCDEKELVDKRFYVKGKTAKLKHDIIEENLKENDISFWIQKHNRYSSLLAQEEVSYHQTKPSRLIEASIFGNPDQKALCIKDIYHRLPLYIRPFLYFFYRYFLMLGLLDGKKGFIFHFLQGFWYRLLIDIKIKELRRQDAA